jgi:hypothetical protein
MSIESALCQCGCGAHVRTPGGRYLRGHAGLAGRITGPGPNPSGLCGCGCGGTTAIATQSDRVRGFVAGTPMPFIQHHHMRLRVKGRRSSSAGYVLIFRPDHPRATTNGSVFEHILVAEAALGRLLPSGAVVHHVDDDKAHNAGTNLCILQTNTDHIELHRRRRVLRAGGNPFTDWICSACKRVKAMTEFRRRADGRVDCTCLNCERERGRRRKRDRRRAA